MISLCATATSTVRAADDEARLKEMLHRTQEALRQAQSDNADLQRAKTEAEQKLQAASKQLDALQSADKGQKAEESALRAKLSGAEGSKDELNRKYAAAAEQLAATNAKLLDTSKQLSLRDEEVKATKQALEQSRTEYASCENKNITLYGYSEQVLKLYKNKGVWASISQKEPVLGLKEVQVENVVQEYQLKFESQKVKP